MSAGGRAPGLTLDAGALIAIDKGSYRIRALLERAEQRRYELAVPAGPVGQAWRDGARQARLARFLSRLNVDIVDLDGATARAAGELCGRSGHPDMIDASVVLCAHTRRHAAVTSDPDDLRRVDPRLQLIVI
ncbi:MAG: hypothetical protein ACRDN9_07495 [Streptosporangiaceae bacterium]